MPKGGGNPALFAGPPVSDLRNRACPCGVTSITNPGGHPMKGILAWVIGIPIPIIILLYLFDVF